MLAGSARAAEVRAVVKEVKADQRMLVFAAGGKDHGVRVPTDVKVVDGEGRVLPEGIASKQLQPGVSVTLVVEATDGKRVLRTIRLQTAGHDVPTPTKPSSRQPQQETSHLTPLTDLGPERYQGFEGGLYPEGRNNRPAEHEAAGVALAGQIRPLDAAGRPADDGTIVLLGIGFSNTVQAFNGFQEAVQADPQVNPHLVLVNGAVGGRSAAMIQNPDDQKLGTQYWATVDERLQAAHVTREQVQVVWIKETDPAPHQGGFPKYIQTLEQELTKIVQILPRRFPNVRLAYLSSRTYGGWAMRRPNGAEAGNSEPFSYESGFAVKWLIERQIAGDAELNFAADRGDAKAPWLSWAAYLWTNGAVPRKDGVFFAYDDFSERDRMHESPAGQKKVGGLLLKFFKTDPTTRAWFVNSSDANAELNAENDWERLSDGSLGKTTEFAGVGGLSIPAYIRKPAGPGPFPVVMLLHGGQYGPGAAYAMGRSTRSPTKEFIDAGWAVYSIDYRPVEGLSIEPVEFDDTVEAVKAVRKFPFVDPQRIGLFGCSHGAQVGSRVVSRAKLQGAVLCAPAALDLTEVKRAADRGEPLVPILQKLVRDMEQKHKATADEIWKDPAKYGYSSAITEVADVACPVLIVNGKNDDNSPTSIIEIYVRKLKAAGKQVETYLPDNGPHGFYVGRPDIAETKEAARRAVAFFQRQFKEPTPAEPSRASQAPPTQYQYGPMDWVDPDRTVPDGAS